LANGHFTGYFHAISNSSAEGDVRFLGGQGSAREYVCAEREQKVYLGEQM
jgi:hypothetical protein